MFNSVGHLSVYGNRDLNTRTHEFNGTLQDAQPSGRMFQPVALQRRAYDLSSRDEAMLALRRHPFPSDARLPSSLYWSPIVDKDAGRILPDNAIYGGVTDPNHYDPDNFRFLVHGFQRENNFDHVEGISSDQLFYNHRRNISFNYPELLAHQPSISASLIDHEHSVSYGEFGYIIETPNSNIIATYPEDNYVSNENISALNALSEGDLYSRHSGEYILDSMKERLFLEGDASYNEIVIGGIGVKLTNYENNPVNVVGYYAQPWIKDESRQDFEHMKTLAEKTSRPFIELPDYRQQVE